MARGATTPSYEAPGENGARGGKTAYENPHNASEAGELKAIWDYLKSIRWQQELDAFMNENYYTGEHYMTYNFTDNRIEVVPFSQVGSNTTINRVKEKVTQAIAFLTKENFRWDVQPAEGVDPTQLDENRREIINSERDWSDYQARRNNLDELTPELALEAAKFSISWLMCGYDAEEEVVLDNGEKIYGDVWVDVAKWWTVFPDALARKVELQRFMGMAEPVTIGALRRDYKNAEALNPDTKSSPSEYEEQLRKLQFAGSVGSPSYSIGHELQTMIRVRLWYWKWVQKKIMVPVEAEGDEAVPGTETEDPNNPEGASAPMDEAEVPVEGMDPIAEEEDTRPKEEKMVWVRELWEAHMTEDGLVLKNEKHNLGDFFPFELFRWDAPSGKIPGEGLVRQIRLPNKALNRLVTSLLEYADAFKGKILEPRKANVQIINDEHGERVQYDAAGGRPEYWQVPPINSAVNVGIDYLEKKIDDLSMMHAEFSGKSGFSGQSGYHAEVIATGDANNFAITKNNLHRAIGRIFKKMLIVAAQEYKKQGIDRNLYSKTNDRRFKIAGQDINVDDNITVGTQPSFAATKQYLIETVLKLAELGWIGPEQGLKMFQFTEVDQILRELEERSEGLATGDQDAAVAELENRAIAAGQKPPGPQQGFNFEVHQEIHMAYLKSPEVANNNEVKGKLMALMDWESQQSQQQGGLPEEVAGQAAPAGPPVTTPPAAAPQVPGPVQPGA